MRLPLKYYLNDDVLFLAQDLLGKVLITNFGTLTGGIITETEAYRGPEDKGSHAYLGRRTARNEVMYAPGGVAYIYTCYGINDLFNIVTHGQDIPHAILIRAIDPLIGLEKMFERYPHLPNGPGKVTRALGLAKKHNGESLMGPHIWVEDHQITPKNITTGPRVGIDYAEEHALLPWRFNLKTAIDDDKLTLSFEP